MKRETVRKYLLEEFKRLKKQKDNKICYLILDRTTFKLPKRVTYGYLYWDGKDEEGEDVIEYGEEYSICLAYFPVSGICFLLDWERVDKYKRDKDCEVYASERMLARIIKNFRQDRLRVRAFVGDKLYFNHTFFEMEGLKDVSEGFVSKPKRNSILKEEMRLLELGREEFYKGKIKFNEKAGEIYEIDQLSWEKTGYLRKNAEYRTGDYRVLYFRSLKEDKDKEESKYYVSNCTHLIDAKEIFRIYEYRWEVEKFFQVAKCNFGEYAITKYVNRREMRLILKFIGIIYFFLHLRRRRIKIDSNNGNSIKNLVIKFIMEAKYGIRICNSGKKYIPPPDLVAI